MLCNLDVLYKTSYIIIFFSSDFDQLSLLFICLIVDKYFVFNRKQSFIMRYAFTFVITVALTRGKAIQMYRNAADNGDVELVYLYTSSLSDRIYIPKDKTKAANYFKMAVDLGHIKSMFKIASMLFKGEGIAKQYVESSIYYKILSDKRIAEGMSKRASLLLNL